MDMQLLILLLVGVSTTNACCLSCEEAVKAVEPYAYGVKSCKMVGGMPILQSDTIEKSDKPVNCDTIPTLFAAYGRPVTDCLQVNGSAFFRIDKTYDWEGSWIACHAVPNGNLASIRNIHEFKALKDLLVTMIHRTSLWAWIGLSDQDKEGEFRWADDGSVATYLKFSGNNPKGGTAANCVFASEYSEGVWSYYMPNTGYGDAGCASTYWPICKVPVS